MVDAKDATVVIWHVNTGPDRDMSRMAGAWTINKEQRDTIKLLVSDRRVLATKTAQDTLADIDLANLDFIDPDTTIENLQEKREELQASYESNPKRANLVPPSWPELPHKVDLQCPDPWENSPNTTGVALSLARWLEQVASFWEQIETTRLARKYMPGGPTRRETPIAAGVRA